MKLLIPILIGMLVCPVHAYAEPPAETAKITGVKKGEEVPYNGILLNTSAAAKIFADKEYSARECELRIKFEVEKENLRMKLFLDTTKVSMEALDQKYTSIISIKNTEIERLSKIANENSNNYYQWWAAGGIIVGIGLSLAVVYAVREI